MFNKNIAILYLLAIAFTFGSCKKDMSPDEPFPDEREQTVFVTTNNNKMYGYDAMTGKKTWEKTFHNAKPGMPVMTDNGIFVLSDQGALYSWDLRTQEPIFDTIRFFTFFTQSDIAASNGLIFIPAVDSLYCYNTLGEKQWAYQGFGAPTTPITIHNNKLYIGYSNDIHCLNTDGTFNWNASVGFGDITTTIKATDEALYFATDDNRMNSVSITNGSARWSYTTNSNMTSSPLVYGGMTIFGSDDNNIYCVDQVPGTAMQGQERWTIPTKERVRSSAAIHKTSNTVLIGCHDFNLYAIDHVSGKLKWNYPTGSLILSSPVVMGDYAYFASFDKFMYCINAKTGSLIWKTNTDYTVDGSPVIDNVTTELYNGASGLSEF